jgi:hypothetical protein
MLARPHTQFLTEEEVFPMRRRTRWFLAVAAAGLLFTASSAQASPINVNDPLWYEFGFGAPPDAAISGVGFVPSSGGNSQFAGDPAWTFVLGAGGGAITVTDAFLRVDQFQIFDNLASLGLTSAPSGSGSCGDNPVPCLADPLTSHGIFALGAGAHSITINHVAGQAGAGYFRVDAAVPEPATFGLLGLGVLALAAKARARRRPARVNG